MGNLGHRYVASFAHSHEVRLTPGSQLAPSERLLPPDHLHFMIYREPALPLTWRKNFRGAPLLQNICGNAEGKVKETHTLIFYLHTQPQRSHFHCLCQQEIIAAFHPFVGFLFLGPVFGKKLFCFSVQVVKIYCLNWNIHGYVLLSTVEHFFKAFQCFCSLIGKITYSETGICFHLLPRVLGLTFWSLLL